MNPGLNPGFGVLRFGPVYPLHCAILEQEPRILYNTWLLWVLIKVCSRFLYIARYSSQKLQNHAQNELTINKLFNNDDHFKANQIILYKFGSIILKAQSFNYIMNFLNWLLAVLYKYFKMRYPELLLELNCAIVHLKQSWISVWSWNFVLRPFALLPGTLGYYPFPKLSTPFHVVCISNMSPRHIYLIVEFILCKIFFWLKSWFWEMLFCASIFSGPFTIKTYRLHNSFCANNIS
jgi:hypothetical protein